MPHLPGVFVHPTALVESDQIGPGTKIWAHVHVMKGAVIGPDCNICDQAFIESGAVLGRGVTVKIGARICDGVTIGDGVFVGPGVEFTNDRRPRSRRAAPCAARYDNLDWLERTSVGDGATLGARVIVGCGIRLGDWCFATAGSVVIRDVAQFSQVQGNPARPMGYVCVCSQSMQLEDGQAECLDCGRRYRLEGRMLVPAHQIVLFED